MELSSKDENSPKEHITAIFEDYEASYRMLQTLTNLSNSVIETALGGQCKLLYEILQNADDAFDNKSKCNNIKVQLILLDDYFIIQHNGKAFNYYDVERICDYASQVEEVKASDLDKTGYKGLGFKSLFNLSDCIYVYSNGYSFRFDKSYWPDPGKKPWQVIPIWCEDLPLREKYTYDHQLVTFMMKIKDEKQLNVQLKEVIDRPEILLFLHRVNCVYLNINGVEFNLQRKVEVSGLFHKIIFLKNESVVNTWFSRTYERAIPLQLRKCTQEVSQLIYPDKIKNAKNIAFSFTLRTDEMIEKAFIINGLCYSILPTQLQLSLPYHVNSLFILNLDRTQFHENEWNEFLINQIGYLQINFLKDLAEIPHLKNFVIELLVRKINHPYNIFNRAFAKGFEEAKKEIAWLPAYKDTCLLKLGEAWIDEINFFKQNFKNIQDSIYTYLIDYDVKSHKNLSANEAKVFNYVTLFDLFLQKYYPQLTENSYMKFLSYLYENRKSLYIFDRCKLMTIPFLKTKDGTLISTTKALLEEEKNPIPDFVKLNPVDNKYLLVSDTDSFKNWLVDLGAKRLKEPIHILRKSVFQWIESDTLHSKMDINNHKAIIEYLAKNFEQFTVEETNKLKEKLPILTKSNKFRIATSCYFPNTIALEELEEVISEDEMISTCYDMNSLKDFFINLGISGILSPIDVFRRCILVWIKNGEIRSKFTTKNFKSIIEFLSLEYEKIEYLITLSDKKLLMKMPVLTYSKTFQEAKSSFFYSDVLHIQGFEDVIAKDNLVLTQNLTDKAIEFLKKIGVSESIHPVIVLRRTVLKWIGQGTALSKINTKNHFDILKYVAKHWAIIKDSNELQLETGLTNYEMKILRKLPLLTKSNLLREACCCFWSTTYNNESDKEIPSLESVISSDEILSPEYCTSEIEKPSEIETLLKTLGVRQLRFVDIYDRYCKHLTDLKKMEWFFSELKKYWENHRLSANKNKLLLDLKEKLQYSRVLAKNSILYPLIELYSSKFSNIYSASVTVLPLLAYENLPEDLERWLGIKQELEFPCIEKLLKAVDENQNFRKKNTLNLFRTLLEQLRLKDKNEVKNYSLKLFSNDNKLKLATDLYYFIEEDAVCLADSCYLKRIHKMSHSETLELAELCGVNLLHFNQKVNFVEGTPIHDKSLREFYTERLPLIVLKESNISNKSLDIVLKNVFSKIRSIELYTCQNILVKYPFHKPVETRYYFDNFKVYVAGKWKNLRTKVHMHIKEKLELISDVTEILDMDATAEDISEWLYYQKENLDVLDMISEKIKLLSSHEISCTVVNKHDSGNVLSDNELLVNQDLKVEETEGIKRDARLTESKNNISNDKELVHKDSVDSLSGKQKLFNEDVGFEHIQPTNGDMSTNAGVRDNIHEEMTFRLDANSLKELFNTTDNVFKNISNTDGLHQDFKDETDDDEQLLVQVADVGQTKIKTDDISTDDSDKVAELKFTQNVDFRQELIKTDASQTDESKNNIPSDEKLHKIFGDDINGNKQLFNHDAADRQIKTSAVDLSTGANNAINKDDKLTFRKDANGKLQFVYIAANENDASKNHNPSDKELFGKNIDLGKQSNDKIKIQQYAEEKLNLCTDKKDIRDEKTVIKTIKIEWIYPNKEEIQKLHQMEENSNIYMSTEEMCSAQPRFIKHKKYPKFNELAKNNEPIVKVSLDKNLKDKSDYQLCLSMPYSSIKFDGRKLLITFTDRSSDTTQYDDTSEVLVENTTEIETGLTPIKSQAYEKRDEKSFISKHFYSPLNLHIEPGGLLQGATDDRSHLKKRCEMCVFMFLQGYYENKHPDAQVNLEQGHFTLQWQSKITEVIWLNRNGDSGLEYDLLLKKNGEVKQYIEVTPVDQANTGSFNLTHHAFITGNQFTGKQPECNRRYCIYCVLYEDDSPASLEAEMAIINALYKIVF